jgi:phosphatidylserine/phosphatidylglycerophosphate/cardiolipin synthase-like enzyme
MVPDMSWVLIGTGFTGALTLFFVARSLYEWLFPPTAMTAHFSPKGGCTDMVVREIKAARREILVLAYSFSSKPITEALVDARTRGVRVQVVLDKSNEQDTYTALPLLLQKGVPTVIDAHHAIAHNKVMLIDGHTIVTGSFNFTHQAEVENAENLLIIKHHRELVSTYRKNFDEHKAHSQAPGTRAVAAPAHAAPAHAAQGGQHGQRRAA